jgi:hypothetical protein
MSTSSFRLAKSAMRAIVLLLISSEAILVLKGCDEKRAREPSEQCVHPWTRRGWKDKRPKDSQTHGGKQVRCAAMNHLQVTIGECPCSPLSSPCFHPSDLDSRRRAK